MQEDAGACGGVGFYAIEPRNQYKQKHASVAASPGVTIHNHIGAIIAPDRTPAPAKLLIR